MKACINAPEVLHTFAPAGPDINIIYFCGQIFYNNYQTIGNNEEYCKCVKLIRTFPETKRSEAQHLLCRMLVICLAGDDFRPNILYASPSFLRFLMICASISSATCTGSSPSATLPPVNASTSSVKSFTSFGAPVIKGVGERCV